MTDPWFLVNFLNNIHEEPYEESFIYGQLTLSTIEPKMVKEQQLASGLSRQHLTQVGTVPYENSQINKLQQKTRGGFSI